ncbi:hypothetical protein DFJ73DRAFT_657115 [Zopfochytrium polystomum]|nr:hypothetical protein DFJ73DRAFT_657115 [Zopfochytrium polystomum]
MDGLLSDDAQPSDASLLTQCWINERTAPEILAFQDVLVANLLELIEAQVGTQIADQMDPEDPDTPLKRLIFLNEVERIKFVIRSYLRTRIAKIERQTLHVITDKETRARLSDDELEFAEALHDRTRAHYHRSFLDSFPESSQRLDEVYPERQLSMGELHFSAKLPLILGHLLLEQVAGPGMDNAVFCRVKEDIGDYELNEKNPGETVELHKDDLLLLRYASIRGLLAEGKVELV